MSWSVHAQAGSPWDFSVTVHAQVAHERLVLLCLVQPVIWSAVRPYSMQQLT